MSQSTPQSHFAYPSVIERNDTELAGVAPTLVEGLRVLHEGDPYILGQLAMNEGTSPHKAINSTPDEPDYQLLLKGAMILAASETRAPITVGIGFPYATFQANREHAKMVVQNTTQIDYDASPIGGNHDTLNPNIEQVVVVPEVEACMRAYQDLMQLSLIHI